MFNIIAKNTQKKLQSLVPVKKNLKLAVLGATGPSGQVLLQQALDKGHEVIALVRSPQKVNVKHVNLHIAKVSIFNSDQIAEHISTCDVVISCLGSEFKFFSEITLYSESAKAIAMGMRKAKVKRLLCLSAWFVEDKSDHPWLAKIFKPLFHRYLDDMYRMEQFLLTKCLDLDFTCIRSPEQTNGPMESQDTLIVPDADYSETLNPKLSRADLAKTVLKIADENLFPKKCVLVGLPL